MSYTPRIALLLTLAAAGGLAVGPASVASPPSCPQVMRSLQTLAVGITESEAKYWRHRSNLEALRFGPAQNATAAMDREEKVISQASQLRVQMPVHLRNLRAALSAARVGNCLPAATLQAMEESAATRARRMNFDRLPSVATESVRR